MRPPGKAAVSLAEGFLERWVHRFLLGFQDGRRQGVTSPQSTDRSPLVVIAECTTTSPSTMHQGRFHAWSKLLSSQSSRSSSAPPPKPPPDEAAGVLPLLNDPNDPGRATLLAPLFVADGGASPQMVALLCCCAIVAMLIFWPAGPPALAVVAPAPPPNENRSPKSSFFEPVPPKPADVGFVAGVGGLYPPAEVNEVVEDRVAGREATIEPGDESPPPDEKRDEVAVDGPVPKGNLLVDPKKSLPGCDVLA